ncbi:MAG: hypothetical protein ACJ74J_10735 [Blastocatellia bacterium]
MPLDHSKANVTISVAGIAICRTHKRNQFEFGFLRCDRHSLTLDIQEIELDPVTRSPVHSSLKPHLLRLDQDISIDVVYPEKDGGLQFQRGVSTYTGGQFNRLGDIGDAEDFRWIVDLEGPEFHNRKLRIKNLAELAPTLFISNGILYTKQKTDEAFARISAQGKSSPVALGKFAHGINTDITCPEGGEVIISNRPDNRLPARGDCNAVRLPQSDVIKYLITIENHCDATDESERTDFRLFYDVLEDPEEKEFDLRRIVATGRYGMPDAALKEQGDFALDGYPQNCLTGKLG